MYGPVVEVMMFERVSRVMILFRDLSRVVVSESVVFATVSDVSAVAI